MMLAGQFTRWNETNSAELQRLWEVDGLSSGDIAHIMGITRNAVIGRVNRMGLQQRDSKVQPRIKPRKQYEHRRSVWRPKPMLSEPLPGDMRPLNGAAWAPLAGTVPVGLSDLEPGMCKWPIGDGKPYLFCGTACDGVYCEHHHALSVSAGTPSEREADNWKEAA